MTEPERAPEAEFLQLFAVPLAIVPEAVPPSLNAGLAAWILEERARDPGVQRSNAGGWHSQPDLPVRGVPALDQLFQAIVGQVRSLQARTSAPRPTADYRARFVVQAWATVMEHGDFVHIHDHAEAHWSAVYYVDAGREDASPDASPAGGAIAWINPIGPHRTPPGAPPAPTTFELTPHTGTLVIFPGWLRHTVQPYRGTRPRLAIAANIEARPAPATQ